MINRAKEITDKLKAFREMLLLPKPKDLDFENWLSNFQSPEDKEIAARILQHFIYISDDMIDQMLRTVIGRCGYFLSQKDSSWSHDSYIDNCWYSFVPGENTEHVTDSGYIFIRKLREVLNIPDERIIKFDSLFNKLEEFSSIPQNVILVDDFVGTGAQIDKAWNYHRFGSTRMTLSKHQSKNNHRIIYAPLIVNGIGFSRIEKYCRNLHLEYIHFLGPEYNLFDKNCPCWEGDSELFHAFFKMMIRIANEQKIPITNGEKDVDMQGFGEQGLALAFSHGIPDACPAFFYWETSTWKPLKKHHYHR